MAARAQIRLDLDPDIHARLGAEAERRGTTLDALVHEAVESWLESGWDGSERRRDQRTVLEATGTGAAEHRP